MTRINANKSHLTCLVISHILLGSNTFDTCRFSGGGSLAIEDLKEAFVSVELSSRVGSSSLSLETRCKYSNPKYAKIMKTIETTK